MGFIGFDGQMMARAQAYLKKLQDAQSAAAVTATALPGGGGIGSGPYERNGPKATDAPSTMPDVAAAVKRLAQADKDRTLMAAIDRLHARRSSNGKPVVYVPE